MAAKYYNSLSEMGFNRNEREAITWWEGPGWYEEGSFAVDAPATRVAAPIAPAQATTAQELQQAADTGGALLTYQQLVDAGMWNLGDPNSQVWAYLAQTQGGAPAAGSPVANGALGADLQGAMWQPDRITQLAASLVYGGLQIPPDQYATAFSGLSEEDKQHLYAEVQRIHDFYTDQQKPDFFEELSNFILPALGAAFFGPALTAEMGAVGAGATLGGVTGGVSGGSLEDALKGAALGAAGGAASEFLGGTGGLPDPEAVAWGSGLEGSADLAAMQAAVGMGGTPATLADLAQLGPPTGTVLEPGLQTSGAETFPVGTAGQPTLAAIAEGAGPFIPVPQASTGGSVPSPSMGSPEQSLVGPPTGSVLEPGAQASGAQVNPVGTSGVPEVTATATGSGPFIGALGTSLAGQNLGGGINPTGPASGGAAATAAGGSALSRILDGTATTADYLSAFGSVAPSLLSMFGLNQQSETLAGIAGQQRAAEEARYQDLVRREQERFNTVSGTESARLADLIAREQERFGTLMGREDAAIGRQRGDIEFGRSVGAPYRDQLAALYANPNSFLSSDAVTAPVNQATNSLARALSVRGNPAGSPAAMAEIEKYAANSLAGLLGQEKDRLAQFGGLSAFNQAGAAVPGIGTNLSGSVPTPGSLYSGAPGAGSGVGTSGGLSALLGSAQADAARWGDLGRGLGGLFSLV